MKNGTFEVLEHIEPLAAEWELLAQETRSSPFLWPGWISAWWSAFGTGRLRILAAYQGGRLVGVLPLRSHRGVLYSTTNTETPLFGFLAANEMAAKQLADALFYQRARRINLSFLDSGGAGISSIRATACTTGYRVIENSIECAPYLAIEGTNWEAYESGLNRKLRGDVRRRKRRLEEQGELTLEVFDGKDRLDELLEEGFRVEGLGWKDAVGTSIGKWPAAHHFYTECARWAADRGLLRLAFLRLGRQTLAFDYCLEYSDVHYLLKTGYDPAYDKFSPGKVLRYLMLARAFSEGLASYDFGGAPVPWKRSWTNTNQELQFVQMFAPTTVGVLDGAVFMGRRAAIEIVKNAAQSPAFPDSGRHLLDAWRRRIDRKRSN